MASRRLLGPREDAKQSPVTYPFRGYFCNVTFQREQTGARTFDLDSHGLADYGLIADLLAHMQQYGGASQMRSSSARPRPLRMWQLAYAR